MTAVELGSLPGHVPARVADPDLGRGDHVLAFGGIARGVDLRTREARPWTRLLVADHHVHHAVLQRLEGPMAVRTACGSSVFERRVVGDGSAHASRRRAPSRNPRPPRERERRALGPDQAPPTLTRHLNEISAAAFHRTWRKTRMESPGARGSTSRSEPPPQTTSSPRPEHAAPRSLAIDDVPAPTSSRSPYLGEVVGRRARPAPKAIFSSPRSRPAGDAPSGRRCPHGPRVARLRASRDKARPQALTEASITLSRSRRRRRAAIVGGKRNAQPSQVRKGRPHRRSASLRRSHDLAPRSNE